ncbi:MAG: barstar family protein [Rhodocyclaceae bacterium]|nr:barstar family protein [Rhodocyclaceae bacterium]
MISSSQTPPQDFLAGPNGLMPLPPTDYAALPLYPDEDNTHCIEIALGIAAKKAGILAAFARAFDMPRWFGHNWDALYDCLTDLDWLPAGDFVVLLSGSIANAQDRATLVSLLEEVCDAWQARGVAFHLFIDPALIEGA